MKEWLKSKKKNLIAVLLLLSLVVGITALGVTAISQDRQPHPSVEIPASALQEEEIPEETVALERKASLASPGGVKTEASQGSNAAVQTQSTRAATLLQLYKRQDSDNVPFYVTNMFPGDCETKYYCVRVAHSQSLTLHFRADVRPGYETLAQVLRCTVKQGSNTLYDGLMSEMPKALDTRLTTTRRVTRDVVYEISAYLDTSVGNAYQDQELWADFRWWIEEKDSLNDLPKTGDDFQLTLWAIVAGLSLIGLLVLLALLGRKDRRLARMLGTLILLALVLSALFVSVYAATWLGVDVKNNYFHTGTVKINLNDGNPITNDEMFRRFEPGMTVNTSFFVQNESTDAVYYKLYMKDVEGSLADVLEVSILDGSDILYTGKVTDCTRIGVGQATETLALNERKELTVSFYFPREAGNEYQDKHLRFVLCADAVQTKNNPEGVFE